MQFTCVRTGERKIKSFVSRNSHVRVDRASPGFKGHGNVVPKVQLSILIFILHHSIMALFTHVKYRCRNESAEIPSSSAAYSRLTLPDSPHKPLQMSTLLKLYTEIQL